MGDNVVISHRGASADAPASNATGSFPVSPNFPIVAASSGRTISKVTQRSAARIKALEVNRGEFSLSSDEAGSQYRTSGPLMSGPPLL